MANNAEPNEPIPNPLDKIDEGRDIVRRLGATETTSVLMMTTLVQLLPNGWFKAVASVVVPVLTIWLSKYVAWRIEQFFEDIRRKDTKREMADEKDVAQSQIAFIKSKYNDLLTQYDHRQQQLLQTLPQITDEAVKAQLLKDFEEIKLKVEDLNKRMLDEIAEIKVNLDR